jgi:hypothetical protein
MGQAPGSGKDEALTIPAGADGGATPAGADGGATVPATGSVDRQPAASPECERAGSLSATAVQTAGTTANAGRPREPAERGQRVRRHL